MWLCPRLLTLCGAFLFAVATVAPRGHAQETEARDENVADAETRKASAGEPSSALQGYLEIDREQAGDRGEEKPLSYWADQLGNEHYLRRELASEKLIDAGPAAVNALQQSIRAGDLETIERATRILSSIAMTHPPSEDGGSWEALQQLASESAGRRASSATSALQEIRAHRALQAREALASVGVFVGIGDFALGNAMSQPVMLVDIDNSFHGDTEKLQWLRWLSGIPNARISDGAVRSEVLAEVVRIPGLHTLMLVDGKVDDQVIEQLQKMNRIQSLEFRYVPLTDKQAELIGKLPIRVSLHLMGTGVSDEKVVAMRDRLPGLEIEHRQGGFLGVSCSETLDRCRISSIVPDSAAEQAGLMPDDVIVRVGESKVGRFHDLQEAINQHVPGDEVEVAFMRGEQLRTVKLRLGRLEQM